MLWSSPCLKLKNVRIHFWILCHKEQIQSDLLFFTVLNSRKNTKITINESLIFDFRFYILPTKRYTIDTKKHWILNAKLSFSRIFGNFVRDIWEILYVMLKGWNHNDFSLFSYAFYTINFYLFCSGRVYILLVFICWTTPCSFNELPLW